MPNLKDLSLMLTISPFNWKLSFGKTMMAVWMTIGPIDLSIIWGC